MEFGRQRSTFLDPRSLRPPRAGPQSRPGCITPESSKEVGITEEFDDELAVGLFTFVLGDLY